MVTLHSSIKPADSFTQAFRVVLHQSSRPGEFVTHLENVTLASWSEVGGETKGYVSKACPDYYWGHYFSDQTEALADYQARCKRYNLSPLNH